MEDSTQDSPSDAPKPARKWNAVRVFVSSTFRDMRAERDELALVHESESRCRETLSTYPARLAAQHPA